MAFFFKLKLNYLSKMHGYPQFTKGTHKDLLSPDNFKPHKNIPVLVSIGDRKIRGCGDAQNGCAITIVGTVLKCGNLRTFAPIVCAQLF